MICATYLFAAAVQVIAIHADHTEFMNINQYIPEQHIDASVLYCDGWPMSMIISPGKIEWIIN